MSENTQSSSTELAVDITPAAIAEVKRLISEENESGIFLRLGVAAGGCSGMSYSMGFDTTALEDDREYDVDGLQVRIDHQSLDYLKGTILDYKGGMLGSGFQFSNPNAKRSCGCGSSFTC